MRPNILLCACVLACGSAAVQADPVDALRDGEDMHFDLRGATAMLSGAVSDTIPVADEDAPATCVMKASGTLDIVVDLQDLGAPFPIVATFTGTKLSPTTVRWTTDFMPNVCITVEIDGTPVDLLIRRVSGQLTSEAQFVGGFTDAVCERGYNVALNDTGGDAANFIDVEAYALCIQNIFTRVDVRMRDVDSIGFGGANCPGDTNGDGVVDFTDFSVVLAEYGMSGPGLQGDLNGDGVVDFTDFSEVLANYGQSC